MTTKILRADAIEDFARLDGMIDAIIKGDALEVMRRLPSKSIDVVITSPPYNLQ